MQKSRDTQHFDQLSRQRVDFTSLANGGQRARLTVTLPGGRTFAFVEDVTPSDVYQYEQQIAGVEIGLIQEVGGVGAFDFGSLTKGGIAASPLGKAGKAVGKVAKKIVTSKVMQTAAKGLALIAPALGPLAPAALGVSAGIGVAGKLMSAKNAGDLGATLTSAALAQSAVSDAQKLSPQQFPSLLRIATDKANSALSISGGLNVATKAFGAFGGAPRALAAAAPRALAPGRGFSAAAPRGFAAAAAAGRGPYASPAYTAAPSYIAPGGGGYSDAYQLVASGRVQSDRGGATTPEELQLAQANGRLFFVNR